MDVPRATCLELMQTNPVKVQGGLLSWDVDCHSNRGEPRLCGSGDAEVLQSCNANARDGKVLLRCEAICFDLFYATCGTP